MRPRVLITGCGLTINSEFRIWGDLWDLGDVFIFNACGDEEGSPIPFDPSERQLILDDTERQTYFQRHNVFVVSKYYAQLNPAAAAYIEESL